MELILNVWIKTSQLPRYEWWISRAFIRNCWMTRNMQKELEIAFQVINHDFKNIDKRYMITNLQNGNESKINFTNDIFNQTVALFSGDENELGRIWIETLDYFAKNDLAIYYSLSHLLKDMNSSICNSIRTYQGRNLDIDLFWLDEETPGSICSLAEENTLFNRSFLFSKKNLEKVKYYLAEYTQLLAPHHDATTINSLLNIIFDDIGKSEYNYLVEAPNFVYTLYCILETPFHCVDGSSIDKKSLSTNAIQVIKDSNLRFKYSLIFNQLQSQSRIIESPKRFDGNHLYIKTITELLRSKKLIKFINENDLLIPDSRAISSKFINKNYFENKFFKAEFKRNISSLNLFYNNINYFNDDIKKLNNLTTADGIICGKLTDPQNIDNELFFDLLIPSYEYKDNSRTFNLSLYEKLAKFKGEEELAKEICLILNDLTLISKSKIPNKNCSTYFESGEMIKFINNLCVPTLTGGAYKKTESLVLKSFSKLENWSTSEKLTGYNHLKLFVSEILNKLIGNHVLNIDTLFKAIDKCDFNDNKKDIFCLCDDDLFLSLTIKSEKITDQEDIRDGEIK